MFFPTHFTLPSLRIVATNSGRCLAFFFFVHEADGLLHKIREISFLQSERVASSVELFLNNTQVAQFLEMFDAAVVVASNLPRHGRYVEASIREKHLEYANTHFGAEALVKDYELLGRHIERRHWR